MKNYFSTAHSGLPARIELFVRMSSFGFVTRMLKK